MKNICLNFTGNSERFKFKLDSIKTMNNNKFLTFTTKKQVHIPSSRCIIELEMDNKVQSVCQLDTDVSQLTDFYKDNKKYLQQEYILENGKVMLRYNIKLLLVEIVYKI